MNRNSLLALGIIEIVIGILAIIFSSIAGYLVILFLGAAIIVSGLLELFGSISQNNIGRTALGIIGILAGIILLLNPILGVNFISILIGIYLIAVGIARLFGTQRPLWARIGGAIGIILGIIILATFPNFIAALVGIFIGVSIIIDGVITTAISMTKEKIA